VRDWGDKSSAPRDIGMAEEALERKVSAIIRGMPFLWLAVDDEPGPDSLREVIERNAIALLSNLRKPPPHAPACALARPRRRIAADSEGRA
jgi:hypothetical protein